MVDRVLLQEALGHVEQAALLLSRDGGERDLAVALVQLEEVRARLSAAAVQEAAPAGAERPVDDRDAAEDAAVLERRVRLDGDLRAGSAARSFSRVTCASWGVPPAATSTVVDLASELVSNAARHVGGELVLALELRGRSVLVTVSDAGDQPPRLLAYRPGVSEHGIGLRLVDQLSESWGWTAAAGGKEVWARAELSERPSRVPRRPHDASLLPRTSRSRR